MKLKIIKIFNILPTNTNKNMIHRNRNKNLICKIKTKSSTAINSLSIHINKLVITYNPVAQRIEIKKTTMYMSQILYTKQTRSTYKAERVQCRISMNLKINFPKVILKGLYNLMKNPEET